MASSVDGISNDLNASNWLNKYGIQKDWVLRHVPAPWDKSIRVSPLTIATYENNVPMVISKTFQFNSNLVLYLFLSLLSK